MSLVSDTVARIMANVEGETKAESVSYEQALEVFDQVAAELSNRADRLRPGVEALARDRESLAAARAEDAEPGFSAAELDEQARKGEPEPTVNSDRAFDLADEGVAATDVPGGNGIPAVAQPENTPATRVDRDAIAGGVNPNANDV